MHPALRRGRQDGAESFPAVGQRATIDGPVWMIHPERSLRGMANFPCRKGVFEFIEGQQNAHDVDEISSAARMKEGFSSAARYRFFPQHL